MRSSRLSQARPGCSAAMRVFSVCTGALLCGAAGLLKGVKATTHWGAFGLLEYFGAIPVNERVVVDGKLVTAAGVTAGIDGALHVATLLRGDRVAQEIQLGIEYAPQPPFNSGTPATGVARDSESRRSEDFRTDREAVGDGQASGREAGTGQGLSPVLAMAGCVGRSAISQSRSNISHSTKAGSSATRPGSSRRREP